MRFKLNWLALLVSISCNSKPEGSTVQPIPPSAPPPMAARQDLNPLADIYGKVAADAVAKYEMVKRTGTPIERCVQAQMVVAAFLQAKDQANYEAWHKVQHEDCQKAGMPQ